jgi:hypothetical protein
MYRFFGLTVALFLLGGTESTSAQTGSLDPPFKTIPFDSWMDPGDQSRIQWTAHVIPNDISNHPWFQ